MGDDVYWGTREPGSSIVEPPKQREMRGDMDGLLVICPFLASNWFLAPWHQRLPMHGQIRVERSGLGACPECGDKNAQHLQGSGVGVADCPTCRLFHFYPVAGSGVQLRSPIG